MVEQVTDGLVQWADLTQGLPPAVRAYPPGWDWLMSLEVAEHVPRGGEATFMHNVFSTAPRHGVVLSWARPGQGGTHHVNCQDEGYVDCAAALLGWEADQRLREQLRAAVTHGAACSWLSRTLMVYRRVPGPARLPTPLAEPTAAFVHAYETMTRERCGYIPDRCDLPRGLGRQLAIGASRLVVMLGMCTLLALGIKWRCKRALA